MRKTTVTTMRCATIRSDLSGVSANQDIPAAASRATARVSKHVWELARIHQM